MRRELGTARPGFRSPRGDRSRPRAGARLRQRTGEPAEEDTGPAEYVLGPEETAFGGRAVRVSILVQGGEAEIEKILTEVVRALAREGGPGAAGWQSTRTSPALAPQSEAGSAEDAGRPALEGLTGREVEVLDQVARGYDNATIAAHLGISARTVRNHLNSVFSKLNIAYRPQAVVIAREAGLGRR